MTPPIVRSLADASATERLGADIARIAVPGDLIFLQGDLGAGKTTFARGFVRALTGESEVPSPTFTLVQAYDGVVHADLYRIADPAEVDELGIEEALESGCALVEWPDNGAGSLPEPTLTVALAEEGEGRAGEGRAATITGTKADRADRTLLIRDFLAAHGYPEAERHFLTGDASARSYETLANGGDHPLISDHPPILMNAPRAPDGPAIYEGRSYSQIAHLAEDVATFAKVTEALRARDLAAPAILARDLDAGLLIVENFGSDTINPGGGPDRDRYLAAARMLAAKDAHDWIGTAPVYDRAAMQIEASLLADWYAPDALGRELTKAEHLRFTALWDDLIDALEPAPRTLVLRDFHSPNIIWRGAEQGHHRIGVIDHQDALLGPTAYDVASLAQDARVDMPADLERAIVDAYLDASGVERASFERSYAIMAAQRASKILGIFVRLDRRDGKPAYREHLPRMRAVIARSLAHPRLADLAAFYRDAFRLGPEHL